jgi:hypothetical protein
MNARWDQLGLVFGILVCVLVVEGEEARLRLHLLKPVVRHAVLIVSVIQLGLMEQLRDVLVEFVRILLALGRLFLEGIVIAAILTRADNHVELLLDFVRQVLSADLLQPRLNVWPLRETQASSFVCRLHRIMATQSLSAVE